MDLIFNRYSTVWKSATQALTWLTFILLVSDLDPKSTEVNKKTHFECKIKLFFLACQKRFLLQSPAIAAQKTRVKYLARR